MSYYNPHASRNPDLVSPASPSSSSGAATPNSVSANSSAFLSSSVSNIWGGLIRRFSSDMAIPTTGSSSPNPAHHQPHLHAHLSNANNGVDGVFTPPQTHRTASPMRPPPLEPLELRGFRDDTPSAARVLSSAVAEEIRLMVPARLSIVDDWNLVYSLDQDGASLSTLYDKCGKYAGKRVGFVLAVKDCEGGIFGAYLSDFPRPSPSYFGTGECFLWRASLATSLPPPPSADTTNLTRVTTIASTAFNPPDLLTPDPATPPTTQQEPKQQNPTILPPPPSPSIRFKAFPYSGVNEYYMFCEAHFLSVGAGDGKYGLWLNDSLEKGVSSTSQTFGNERLSDEGEKFGILGTEVWVIGAGPPDRVDPMRSGIRSTTGRVYHSKRI